MGNGLEEKQILFIFRTVIVICGSVLLLLMLSSGSSRAADPSMKISSVSTSVAELTLGQTVDITVKVTNNGASGGTAGEADVVLELKDDANLGNGDISITNHDFPQSPVIRLKGETVWGNYGQTRYDAKYPAIMGWKNDWPVGESHTMTVRIRPSNIKDGWTYWVKATACNNNDKWSCSYSDPSSGSTDDYSEYVKVYDNVNLKIPKIRINTVTVSTRTITLGETVDISISVKNDGGKAKEADVTVELKDDASLTAADISIVGHDFPQPPVIRVKGESIYGDYGRTSYESRFPVICGWKADWPNAESHTMTVRIRPATAKESWTFQVKATASDYTVAFKPSYSDPASGTRDAYNEYVSDYSLDVANGIFKVRIDSDKTEGVSPLSIALDLEVAGGKSPFSYAWDFGDGAFSTIEKPTHTFSPARTTSYSVKCRVTDSSGNTAVSNSIAIAVNVKSSSSATISADPTEGESPLTVKFSISITGGAAPYLYTWDFGDGGTSSEASPSHTYGPGSSSSFKAICLVVDDNLLELFSNYLQITVSVPPDDTDGDGMPDTWEKAIFGNGNEKSDGDFDSDGLVNIDELRSGTNPTVKDTDEDDLWDGVEIHQKRFDISYSNPATVNLDVNGDGSSDANPLRKDIFIEVDWMDDNYNTVSWNSLYSCFERHFIYLHILKDDKLTTDKYPGRTQRIAYYANDFDSSLKGIYHYIVLGYGYDIGFFIDLNGDGVDDRKDSSGVSSGIPGDMTYISAGQLRERGYESQEVTSTVLHELGHNLGLHHNGNIDTPTNSPDYESVMSYYYQLSPDRWPVGWKGAPSYGSKDSWNDWDHLIFHISANGNDPDLGDFLVDAPVIPFFSISKLQYKGRAQNGSYEIETKISINRENIKISQGRIFYKLKTEKEWSKCPLQGKAQPNGTYSAFLNIKEPKKSVQYYVHATDSKGHESVFPSGAPEETYEFTTAEKMNTTTTPGFDSYVAVLILAIVCILHRSKGQLPHCR